MLVGEVGGNDYNHALLDGASKDLVFTFVPDVVGAISSTVRVTYQIPSHVVHSVTFNA